MITYYENIFHGQLKKSNKIAKETLTIVPLVAETPDFTLKT